MTKDRSGQWRVDESSLAAFAAGVRGQADGDAWFKLRRAAEELALLPAFDRLITLDMNRIEELPHQIRVALQVLQPPMSGRAILADEVGLGKTIEAGIILKELAVRGLARRVLILTPASLVTQWMEELSDKFFEEFVPIERPDDWELSTRAIASYDRARQPAHARALLRHRWDLVIVDEAHKCKNHQTARYKLLQQIERNYLLLLTATPLQNDLRELYNLITLLRPGHLGTWREFRTKYLRGGNTRDVHQPEALRELTSRVMVRTRRASVAHVMNLPARRPHQMALKLTPPELELYQGTARLLRALYRDGFRAPSVQEEAADRRRTRARTGRGIFFLECIRLAQRLCSSASALASSLRELSHGELITPEFRTRARLLSEQAARVSAQCKLDALTTILRGSEDRVVVFSEHLPTIALIANHVRALGRPAVEFTGGLSRLERQRALRKFRGQQNAVLVSSRAGTEGLNLQFCHQLVNYELPWNPMIVEQRIGRIHRIGQTREVILHNLAALGTVEDHILHLLHTKIRLFELVVGELDLILERIGDEGGESIAGILGALWLDAENDAAFAVKLVDLGEQLVAQGKEAAAEERRTTEVAAEDSAGRLVREFQHLTVPGRIRLGYGTVHVHQSQGVEATREELGLHVGEILEMLGNAPNVAANGHHPDYGPLYRITGLTSAARAVELVVQADRLPMMLVSVTADPAAKLVA